MPRPHNRYPSHQAGSPCISYRRGKSVPCIFRRHLYGTHQAIYMSIFSKMLRVPHRSNRQPLLMAIAIHLETQILRNVGANIRQIASGTGIKHIQKKELNSKKVWPFILHHQQFPTTSDGCSHRECAHCVTHIESRILFTVCEFCKTSLVVKLLLYILLSSTLPIHPSLWKTPSAIRIQSSAGTIVISRRWATATGYVR